jgi:hypothetical protein
MQQATATAAPITCRTCGAVDTGTFCSACGSHLAESGSGSTTGMLWEAVVQDRLHDVFTVLKTTWLILLHPVTFFRAVVQEDSHLPKASFPLSGLWRAVTPRPQTVNNPVQFLLLSIAATLLVRTLLGGEAEQAGAETPGVVNAFEAEFSLVGLLLLGGLYAAALHFISGRRIPVGEYMKFWMYCSGASNFITVGMVIAPADPQAVALVAICLFLYIGLAMPYVVIPRLYPITRKQLFKAQVGVVIVFAVIGGVIGGMIGAQQEQSSTYGDYSTYDTYGY